MKLLFDGGGEGARRQPGEQHPDETNQIPQDEHAGVVDGGSGQACGEPGALGAGCGE